MPEKSLFDAPPEPAAIDPKNTSWAAFCSITPFLPSMDGRVLHFIQERGELGATLHELRDSLKMKLESVCGCVGRLRDAGHIVDSGRRRPGQTRRKVKIFIATAAAVPARQVRHTFTLSEYAAKAGSSY